MSSSSSTILPITRPVNHGDESPPISGQLVASWPAGNRQVSVFHASDTLCYSITEGLQVEMGNISLGLYHSPFNREIAPKLIAIFKQVLLSEGVKPSFLPTFFASYKIPSSTSRLLLALFAQLRRTEWGKEVVQAKWGIQFENGDAKVNWLDVTDRETIDFLTGAPLYEKEMGEYCQHFKEVVTLDAHQRIQAIAMRCVSALNRNIFLDENTWAVTLISAQKRVGWGRLFTLGHGSVAWEGVEAGSYFLKLADITTAYENRQPGEAQIRIENRTIPSTNWIRGPTCSRPKDFVIHMVDYLSRGITVKDGSVWSSKVKFSLIAPLHYKFKHYGAILSERRRLVAMESCLSFAVYVLKLARIFLPEPGRVESSIEPHSYVMSLRTNYVTENYDSSAIVFRLKNGRQSNNARLNAELNIFIYEIAKEQIIAELLGYNRI